MAQPARSPSVPFLLLELPSRRLVAQARADVLGAAIVPGSLMKVFTLAAALESGAASAETRIMCRRDANLDGRVAPCVHPDFHRGLSPEEALSYSCNVFFATLARRLQRPALDAVLARSGLAPTNPATPMTQVALGLDGVRATPRQWLEAFLRITGSIAPSVSLADGARVILERGLDGAAREGTAAAFARAGLAARAKTGTAPMPGGGYVGLVAAAIGLPRPTHAIIVLAPGAGGADAAVLATQILAEHGVGRPAHRASTAGGPQAKPRHDAAAPQTAGHHHPAWALRVGLTQTEGTRRVETVDLEDVVARAVAGEGGDSLPAAAREALAITVRTVAIGHRGRHAAKGFDLCDLTHCLALRAATATSRAAAAATRGQVLLWRGRLAAVYFSASCGDHSERPSAVWPGAADPPYLPARPDEVCQHEPQWVSDVPEPHLRNVFAALGFRGRELTNLLVTSRSPSGRAETLGVRGIAPDRVQAETLRLEIGRRLGWQVLKSTLFDVTRTATGFRFVGRGLGHGVGLCVRGAGVRASHGANAVAILGTYFPGTAVGPIPDLEPEVTLVVPALAATARGDIRAMVQSTLRRLSERLAVRRPAAVTLVFHPTVEAYTRQTGMPWWTAGRTRGTHIDLLPIETLTRRGILDQTVAHELVHVLADADLAQQPLWVREGLARVLAGERVGEPAAWPSPQTCPSDEDLRHPTSAAAWRRAYDAAGACVVRAMRAGTDWRNLR